jgi:hypothetical protein
MSLIRATILITIAVHDKKSKYEDDPPLVTAVVVADEEMTSSSKPPPATNPDHQPLQVTTSRQPEQQQQPTSTKPGILAFLQPQQPVTTLTTTTPTNYNNHAALVAAAPAPAAGPTPADTNGRVVTTYQVAPPSSHLRTTYTHLGRNPTGLQCPYCSRQMVTTTKDVIGVTTIIAVIVICLLFWPLAWLPLCIPSCKRTHHFCGQPMCRAKVGETKECA